jgi:ABC-type transporter Mla MlaB component
MAGPSSHRIEISGDAGLRTAQDIAATLRQALADHDSLTIDTSAMTGVDLTTVQLLLAARKQALAAGKSLKLAAPASGALHQFLIQTGCLDAAGRPLTPDGDFWLDPTSMHGGKAA